MFTKSHISFLDSIRGLAALAVISEHFVISYGLPCETRICRKVLDDSPFNFWWDGGAAVSMFFVLSGFVLSLKYFRVGHKPDLKHFNLMQYTIGRLFRIWLPYCVILFISGSLYLQTIEEPMLTTHLVPSDWLVAMWRNYHLTVMDMVRESFLLQLPQTVVLLPQAWTLTIELVLSLLLPIGLLLAERGIIWLVFFTFVAVIFLGVSSFLFHFLMGLLIARYYSAISDYLTVNVWQRRMILLIGIFFYTSGSIFQGLDVNEKLVWFSSGFGAGLIILFALSSSRAQTFLSLPILRQIGKVSYSAYLIHMAILICLTPHLLKGLESFTTNRTVLWFGGWLMTVAIVQLLSLLSYHWLETPSMAIGQRIMQVPGENNVSNSS